MPNPIYRQTIAEAWRLTRRHKFLWFFGFFAILMNSGVASGIETFFNNVSLLANSGDNIANVKQLYEANTLGFIASNVGKFFNSITLENAVTLLLVAAIFIFFIWISIVSQGSLITATDTFRQGKDVSPEQSFMNGTRLFWPLLWLNLMKYILTIGIVIVLGLPLLSLYLVRGQDFWMNILLFLNFIILVPGAMIIAFLLQFASAYVSLKKLPLWSAIRSAWALFLKHWLATIEMAFLLFLIYFLATAVLSIVFLPQILNMYVNSVTGLLPGLAGYMNVSNIALLIIAVFLTAIFSTFQYTATTLFFIKLEQGTIVSKFVRWFGHWGNVGEKQAPVLKAATKPAK
ncbi:MAG: hypothetical protein Q8O51_00560 [bacterium]|nr:hypothetical protein [bacterium]